MIQKKPFLHKSPPMKTSTLPLAIPTRLPRCLERNIHRLARRGVLAAILLGLPFSARAATVVLSASDTGTTASFATGTNWTGGAAPTAGNAYTVGGGLILQVTGSGTAETFAGTSLTIGDGSASAATLSYIGSASTTITVGTLLLNNGTFKDSAGNTPTLAGGITLLSGGGTFDIGAASHTQTISAIISGSGPLTLENSANTTPTGTGITISGANTYTGATTIAADTLVTLGGGSTFVDSASMTIDAGSTLEGKNYTYTINNLSGAGTLDSNTTAGTVTIDQTTNGTLTGGITYSSGTGVFNITKTGAATLTLSGANTFNNSLTINNGAIDFNASTASLSTSASVALKMGGGSYIYDNTATSGGTMSQTLLSLAFTGGDSTVESVLGGAASSTLNFTTALAATTPSTGATGNFIASGTNNSINLLGNTTAGFLSSALFFNGANYAYLNAAGGSVRAPVYGTDAGFVNAGSSLSSGNHNQVSSSISGQGAVSVDTIKFATASEVDLALTGALTLTNGGLLRSGGGATTISGGSINNGVVGAEYVFRTDSAADSLTISSNVLNNGSSSNNALVKSGAGTLILSGINTYQGVTYIDDGILSIGQNVNLGNQASGAGVTINNGTLQATATFGLYNGTAGTNDRAVSLANNADIDVTGSNTLTIHGVVANSGALTGTLVKSNTGTLILSGADTYTGATTVNAGTLLVNGSLAAASAVAVNSSATLGGTGTVNGAITLNSGGFIAPATAGAIGTLTGSSLTWNGGGALTFDLGTGTTSDLLTLSGALTKGTSGTFTFDFNDLSGGTSVGTTYTLIDFASTTFSASDFSASGESGTFTLNGTDLQFTVAAVPEPATYSLLTLAGLALLAVHRRRFLAAL